MADQKAKIDVNRQKTGLGVSESGDIRQVTIEDTTDRLLVSATTTTTPPSTIVDGLKTVSVPGTAEILVASATCKSVVIQAFYANGNIVAIGASTVVAAIDKTGRGFSLQPGQAIEIQIDDPSKIFVDAITAGEGVSFFYTN